MSLGYCHSSLLFLRTERGEVSTSLHTYKELSAACGLRRFCLWELSTLRSPIISRISTSSCLVRVCLQLSQQYVMSLKAITVKSAHTAFFAIGTPPPAAAGVPKRPPYQAGAVCVPQTSRSGAPFCREHRPGRGRRPEGWASHGGGGGTLVRRSEGHRAARPRPAGVSEPHLLRQQ